MNKRNNVIFQHTPSPWKVVSAEFKDDGIVAYEIKMPIAEISQANANLIAAAPELLEAARNFVAWVDDVWGSAALSPKTLAEYEKAKLAIAKAEEGGSQHE
jgi:hypothetical protein